MKTQHLHVLGVCGTAMAAITALAQSKGWRVTGSDAHVYPPMSTYLENIGVSIAPFSAKNLNPAPDLCLIGNAMSRGNVEVEYILNHALPYMSGPAFIGHYILPQRHAAVVSGTHGKTSTAALLAHVLDVAGQQPGFMIGGIPENFGEGARLGRVQAGSPFVLEGDEYDTAFFDKRSKFIHYHPQTLILNNLEFDHADIFADLDAIKTQFSHMLRIVPQSGDVIANADDDDVLDVIKRGCWSNIVFFAEYGDKDCPWQWQVMQQDGSHFKLYHDGQVCCEVQWDSWGKHQVSNACAVAAAAKQMGVKLDDIQHAFTTFKGVRRRMSKVGERQGITIYDDFAHHPTAIQGVVEAVQANMAGKGKLWVVIEPRSNTMRSHIHQSSLPQALLKANHVIFTPPATRQTAPQDLLDVDKVCTTLKNHDIDAKVLETTAEIIENITKHAKSDDIVLILSNGAFDGIHHKLLHAL